MSRMGLVHLGGGENSAGEGTGQFPRHEKQRYASGRARLLLSHQREREE